MTVPGADPSAHVPPPGDDRTTVLDIDSSWVGFGGVHGGVVVAAAIAAAAPLAAGELLTVGTQFLAPTTPGTSVLHATALVPGRRTSYLVRDRSGASVSLARFARGARGHALVDTSAEPAADTPGPQADRPGVGAPPVTAHLEFQVLGTHRPLGGGAEPRLEAWVRLVTDGPTGWRFSPTEAAAVLLDSLPPGLYSTLAAPVPIPTIELTAHFAPAEFGATDWALVRQRTVWASATHCVDDTTVHTRSGQLVAQARQARRILTGR